MTTTNEKLSRHTVWLFAFGSIAAGIGASTALSGMGQKATAGIYFAIVAIGAFASTYLTRAKVGGAIGAFVLASAVAAVSYFFLVEHLVHSATTVMSDAVSAGAAHAQGDQAGAAMGQTMGMFVAAIVFLETLIAGVGGAIVGGKSRGQTREAALAAMARAAR